MKYQPTTTEVYSDANDDLVDEMVAKCRSAMRREDEENYDTQYCRGYSKAMEEAAQMVLDASRAAFLAAGGVDSLGEHRSKVLNIRH